MNIMDSNPPEITREMLENVSLEWETRKGWERWVCQPVYKFPLAPRYALAVLIQAGKLAAAGVTINKIVGALIELEKSHKGVAWTKSYRN